LELESAEVEQRWRVPRNPLANRLRASADVPSDAEPNAPFTYRQRQAVPSEGQAMVAGRAGDIAVTAQKLVVEQQPAQFHLLTGVDWEVAHGWCGGHRSEQCAAEWGRQSRDENAADPRTANQGATELKN